MVLFPLLLSAQEATVNGLVVDAKTRQPLSGVAVRLALSSEEALLTESDAQGRFRFEEVASGTYSASALRSGYQWVSSASVQVYARDKDAEIVLELKRYSVMAGRVLDRLGRPVVGAKVTVYQRELDRYSMEPYWADLSTRGNDAFASYKGVTDDRGEYRVWGLPKGRFLLVAKPSPAPGATWGLRFDAAPTFYPNSPTFDEASRIELGWGEVREGIDIQLGDAAPTRQSGQVVSEAGPCARCGFAVFRKGRGTDVRVGTGATSPRGEIVLEGLPPGEYIAGASARAQQGPRAVGMQEFVVSREEDRPFLLHLEEPVTVRGRVIFEDPPEKITQPRPSGAPFPTHNFGRVMHHPRDWEKHSFGCQSDVPEFHGEGAERFFEAIAAPGHCRILVVGPPDSYVAGMSLDGRPLEAPELTIPPGGLPSAVTVRLRFDTGAVEGRVEGGDANTWVHFVPAGSDPFARLHSMRVEPGGSFRANVPPGHWRAHASRLRFPSTAPDSGSLPQVEVKAGETTTLTELIPPLGLE